MQFKKDDKPSKPTTEKAVSEPTAPTGNCPDCKGLGIRNPDIDHRVCQTCEGSGNI